MCFVGYFIYNGNMTSDRCLENMIEDLPLASAAHPWYPKIQELCLTVGKIEDHYGGKRNLQI